MLLQYLAPLSILTGAGLTSLNRGARLTGIGFIFFTLGSACFAILAYSSEDMFGMLVNLALTGVNAFGVHRWLRHNAVVEDMAKKTEAESERSFDHPSVLTATSLVGQSLYDGAEVLGEITDAIINLDDGRISYVVVHRESERAGSGFAGVAFDRISRDDDNRYCCKDAHCQLLSADIWPSVLAEPK